MHAKPKITFPHRFEGTVERFPGKGGWHYVMFPTEDLYKTEGHEAKSGFIPILAKVGHIIWRTSILPFGKGMKFVALKAQVRKEQNIELGNEVEVYYRFVRNA